MDDLLAKFEKVIEKFVPEGRLVEIRPLEGGISAQMMALDIVQSNGEQRTVIARFPSDNSVERNPQAGADEFKLLQSVQAAGLPTSTPFYLDQSNEIFSKPYLLIEYVNGQMEFNSPDKADFTKQYATQLVDIHRVDMNQFDFSFLPRHGNRCGAQGWLIERPFNNMFREEPIRKLLADYSLVGGNTAVLLHGDYWPGNVLWRDNKLIAVIDWEDAEIGDPLIDLAIARSELVWILGVETMLTFTQHYQSQMEIDYSNLPYWDLCATLRFLYILGDELAETAAFFEDYGRFDITEQSIKNDYNWFIDQALAKLK